MKAFTTRGTVNDTTDTVYGKVRTRKTSKVRSYKNSFFGFLKIILLTNLYFPVLTPSFVVICLTIR